MNILVKFQTDIPILMIMASVENDNCRHLKLYILWIKIYYVVDWHDGADISMIIAQCVVLGVWLMKTSPLFVILS
jgi:hypothetical protein